VRRLRTGCGVTQGWQRALPGGLATVFVGLALALASAGSGRAAPPAAASPAAALAVAPAGSASPPIRRAAAMMPAAPLGRLFFTAEERRRIDAGDLPPAASPVAAAASAATAGGAPEAAPPPVRVDGVLRRGDGSQVVWIDGSQAEGGAAPDGARVRVLADGTTVHVQRPGAGPAHVLRPGQSSAAPELGEGNRFEVLR
jgi:hypothetical protein